MVIIASKHGLMVAFLSVAAGVLGILGAGALGATAKSLAIGFLAMGAIAWLLGKHEPERGRACSLFFIPVRAYSIVAVAAGGLFLFLPGTTPTASSAAPAPKSPKLETVETRLRTQTSSGSSEVASEKAASYQRSILGFQTLSGIEGHVSVHLEFDGTDLKEVQKATLYVQAMSLKKYGDEGKKGLMSICLKMMRADFPKAICQSAARGAFLWGAQGSSAGADASPVITLTSDAPKF